MAIVVDAKETPDRDGYLADGRALWGQEGVGAGSVAPNLTLAAQGVEPHHGCLLLPASWALAATLLRAPYPLNLHIGLASTKSGDVRSPPPRVAKAPPPVLAASTTSMVIFSYSILG